MDYATKWPETKAGNKYILVLMDYATKWPETKAGNKYILVLMDYATKWPGAFALRNVTAETIVNCLIEVTARIGYHKNF